MNKHEEIKNAFKIEDVVMKLIGNVQPTGSTQVDKKRLENLEILGDVFYKLFSEISDIIYYNKNHQELSIQEAVEKARKIIDEVCSDYFYDLGYRLEEELK